METAHYSLFERNIELVLAGATKILACNSASLLIIDEARSSLKIWAATPQDEIEGFEHTSELLGFVPKGATVSLDLVGESILLKCYYEKKILETSSISDLVGTFLPQEAQSIFQSFMGKLRFSCVPVVSSRGVEAVILFSKKGDRPFTFQQRQLLLEYASRLGLIIESEKFSEEVVALREKLITDSAQLPTSLRRVLSIETEAMLTLDGAQTIMAINPRAEEMFAARAEELLGSPFEVLFDEEEAARRVLECRLKLLSDGHMEIEARMRSRAGAPFPALISGVLALDEKGKGAGAVVRIKELPEEKRDSQVDLQERLIRSERMALIGEMASQMAHEIRNPLVSIGAALRVIRDDLPQNHPVQEELRMIVGEVDRLDLIIKDYLTLARRSVGRVERIRLEDVVSEAARVVSINPGSRGIEIVVSTEKRSDVMGDFDALKQVFINLLLNAVEASMTGNTVECVIDAKEKEVEVRVMDRGEGFHDKEVDLLFTPFYTTKSKGSGLGLAISKNIVEDLGGRIVLNERAGGGCEAIVHLPSYPG
jgi:PAS domain S-box-containing protein